MRMVVDIIKLLLYFIGYLRNIFIFFIFINIYEKYFNLKMYDKVYQVLKFYQECRNKMF